MVKGIKRIMPMDIYPGKKNGYRVMVTYDTKGIIHEMEQIMHNEEISKWEYLQKMKKKLSKKDFEELEKVIEEYGDFMYEKASDEAAMNAAGEDI